MKSKISPSTFAKTSCPKNYICLNNDGGPDCEVVQKEEDGIIYTLCAGLPRCHYCEIDKLSQKYCMCPVRIELYEKHNI